MQKILLLPINHWELTFPTTNSLNQFLQPHRTLLQVKTVSAKGPWQDGLGLAESVKFFLPPPSRHLVFLPLCPHYSAPGRRDAFLLGLHFCPFQAPQDSPGKQGWHPSWIQNLWARDLANSVCVDKELYQDAVVTKEEREGALKSYPHFSLLLKDERGVRYKCNYPKQFLFPCFRWKRREGRRHPDRWAVSWPQLASPFSMVFFPHGLWDGSPGRFAGSTTEQIVLWVVLIWP